MNLSVLFFSLIFFLCLEPRGVYAQSDAEIDQKLKQAQVYLKNGYPKPAQKELEKIYQTPRGKKHPKVLSTYALIMYENQNLFNALNLLQRAIKYSMKSDQVTLRERYTQWSKGLVQVTFLDAFRQSSGRLEIKRTGKIYNKSRKRAFKQVQDQMNKGIPSPYKTYLPYGKYDLIHANGRLNLKLTSAKGSNPVTLELPFRPPIMPIPSPYSKSTSKSKYSVLMYTGIGLVVLGALGAGIYFATSEPGPQTFTFTF